MFNKIFDKQYDFVGSLKKSLIFPLVIFLIGIVVLLIFGVKQDINFSGGTILEYSYTGEIKMDDAEAAIKEAIELPFSLDVKKPFSQTDLSYLTVNLTQKTVLSVDQMNDITAALIEKFPEQGIEMAQQNTVNPSIGASLFAKALFTLFLAMVFVTFYIGIRFRKIGGISAGSFTLAALIHDMIFCFFILVFFRIPLDMNFIAVMLTILGYSLNNTIVIYDRIREEKEKSGSKLSLRELTNSSINKTLRRTINTTITTFCAIITVCIVAYACGLDSIISFALPMSFGVAIGCFSSVFLSGPLWVHWEEYRAKQNQKKGKGKGSAKGKKH